MLEISGGTLSSEQVAEVLGISRAGSRQATFFESATCADARKARLQLSELSVSKMASQSQASKMCSPS